MLNRQRKLKVVLNTSLLKAKLGIEESVTSGPRDQFDRVLFHVKSSEFRLMERSL